MPGFKAFKDRGTVLLGGSVAGHKLKPSVIWHSENPGPSNVLLHTCASALVVTEAVKNHGWPSSSSKKPS